MKKPKIRGLAAERHPMPENPGSYVRDADGVLERTDVPQELVDGPNEAAPAPVLPEASRRAIADALQAMGAEVPEHLADAPEPATSEERPSTSPFSPSPQTNTSSAQAGGQTEEG